MWTLIRQCAVRVLVLIWITVLDLEPNPDFQTFLIISENYHRIFKCNTSKRRSGQELPFIFFALRAATCLWGRYDPKTENFTYFYIYLLHINFLSKTFYVPVKSYPGATFHVLVAKVYIVTGAHLVKKKWSPCYYYYSFLPDGRDRNRKSPKPHHFQPPNSTHMWTLIR